MSNFETELRRIVEREKLTMLIETGDHLDSVYLTQTQAPFNGFMACPEPRHGNVGFRVARFLRVGSHDGRPYTEGEPYFNWDESYQFYTSIDDFVAAIKCGDYSAGRAAF